MRNRKGCRTPSHSCWIQASTLGYQARHATLNEKWELFKGLLRPQGLLSEKNGCSQITHRFLCCLKKLVLYLSEMSGCAYAGPELEEKLKFLWASKLQSLYIGTPAVLKGGRFLLTK